MKKLLAVLSLCSVIVYFSGCGSRKDSSAIEGEKLQQVFARYQQWFLDSNPGWATYLGYETRAGEMDDYSIEGIEKDYRCVLETIEKLQALDRPLPPDRDKLNQDLFKLKL